MSRLSLSKSRGSGVCGDLLLIDGDLLIDGERPTAGVRELGAGGRSGHAVAVQAGACSQLVLLLSCVRPGHS